MSLLSAMQDTIGVSDEDIIANHQGRITDNQIDRIKAQLRMAWQRIISVVAFPTAFFVILIVLLGGEFLMIALTALAIVLAVGLFRTMPPVYRYDRLVRREIQASQVDALEGILLKEKRADGVYYLGIQDTFLPIPKPIYDAANEGTQAVIYYLPKSRQFLSMEQ